MDQSNYTLPGIMHYLQNQYTIIEKNKIINELEKSELKLKISKLESERNSMILENSKLIEKIKILEKKLILQNGDDVNYDDDKIQTTDESTTTTTDLTIDTANLVRARQFLKNTTNEILYLLNSHAIENTDPLELAKEEPDYYVQQQQHLQQQQQQHESLLSLGVYDGLVDQEPDKELNIANIFDQVNEKDNTNDNKSVNNDNNNIDDDDDNNNKEYDNNKDRYNSKNNENQTGKTTHTTTTIDTNLKNNIKKLNDIQLDFDTDSETITDDISDKENFPDDDINPFDSNNGIYAIPPRPPPPPTYIEEEDEDEEEKPPTPPPHPTNKAPIEELILDGSKDLQLTMPIGYLQLSHDHHLYIYSGQVSTHTITVVNTLNPSSIRKLYTNIKPDINSRKFVIVSAPNSEEEEAKDSIAIIEGCGTFSMHGYLNLCTPEPRSILTVDDKDILYSFNSTILSMDSINNNSSHHSSSSFKSLISVLLDDGTIQIFDIGIGFMVKSHENGSLSQLQKGTKILFMKFNSINEITLITNDYHVIRYDFNKDELVYNLNLNLDLDVKWLLPSSSSSSQNDKSYLSRTHFYHVFDSSKILILELLTQEIQIFQLDHTQFLVKSISVCMNSKEDEENDIEQDGGEIFSLNYSNGVIELYNTSSLDDTFHDRIDQTNLTKKKITRDNNNNNNNNDEDDDEKVEKSISPVLVKLDYYLNYEIPMIIKDVVVELIKSDEDEKDKNLNVYVIGSDLKIKRYTVMIN